MSLFDAPVMSMLDASVVLSFDRSGFERHARYFSPGDLEVSLNGRVCLVTGANSGIGLATAEALARLGASVHLLCRSRERGLAARERIVAKTGARDVQVEVVDVASTSSIRRFVERLAAPTVHVLVNNAGVLPADRQASPDGIELTFATNVVGPFLLTALLLPKLAAAGDARVINVSSGGMYPKKLDLDDWDWRRRKFDGVQAYALTKRAEVVLTEMWAERLASHDICVNAMHPGWVATPSVETSLPTFHALLRRRLRTPEQGADTVVWLAASPAAEGQTGRFWFDRRPRHPYPLPLTRETPEERERLWTLCEQLAAGGSPDDSTSLRFDALRQA